MSNAIVASFTQRGQADAAVRSLHEEGFRRTWLAVVETVEANSSGGAGGTVGAGRETVREVQGGGALRRFFGLNSNRTLYDALRVRISGVRIDSRNARHVPLLGGAFGAARTKT